MEKLLNIRWNTYSIVWMNVVHELHPSLPSPLKRLRVRERMTSSINSSDLWRTETISLVIKQDSPISANQKFEKNIKT